MCANTHFRFEEEETVRHLVKASLWGSMSPSSPREQCFLCHTQCMCEYVRVLFVCVTLDGGGDSMLWIFLSRTFFFNVYSE